MSESRAVGVVGKVIDVFLALLGPIGIYLYNVFGSNILHKSGFHCSDESLSYPYKSSTIHAWLNGAVGVCIPTIIIVADHFVKAKRKSINNNIRLDKEAVGKTLEKLFPILVVFVAGNSKMF